MGLRRFRWYSQTVISAFITYLAQDGFNTDLQWFTQVELWVCPAQYILRSSADEQ